MATFSFIAVGGGVRFSKVVATFSHGSGSLCLFMAPTGDVWINPSFRIWGYVLHVEHILCVITNYGQHDGAIPFFLDSSLQWRHNDHDGVSNHQPHGCLLSRLFRRRSKKTSKLRVTGLCAGNSPGPVNSPHKRPVTRKMFPFDDVIMLYALLEENTTRKSLSLYLGFTFEISSSRLLSWYLFLLLSFSLLSSTWIAIVICDANFSPGN